MNDRYHYIIIIILILVSFSSYLSSLVVFASLEKNETMPSEWYLVFSVLFAIISFSLIIIFILVYTKKFVVDLESSKKSLYFYLFCNFIFSFTLFILSVIEQHNKTTPSVIKNIFISFSALGFLLSFIYFFYFYNGVSQRYDINNKSSL